MVTNINITMYSKYYERMALLLTQEKSLVKNSDARVSNWVHSIRYILQSYFIFMNWHLKLL